MLMKYDESKSEMLSFPFSKKKGKEKKPLS